jgi:hypothetical protein
MDPLEACSFQERAISADHVRGLGRQGRGEKLVIIGILTDLSRQSGSLNNLGMDADQIKNRFRVNLGCLTPSS